MKLQRVLDSFLLYCCIFSTYCFEIEELFSGLRNINQSKLETNKPNGFDPEKVILIYEMGLGKTLENKEYSYSIAEDETVSERNRFIREENEVNASDEPQKDILYLMEQMATTSMPVTDFPHGFIVPGTKWCGRGNIAEREDDFGSEVETDKCCRNHDRCPDHLLPGETKHNLTNNSHYTSSSCECDNAFHECLRQANTIISNAIGTVYFTITAKDCYALDYPTTCKLYMPLFNYCLEYEVDTSAEKIYQWIPAKKYSKL